MVAFCKVIDQLVGLSISVSRLARSIQWLSKSGNDVLRISCACARFRHSTVWQPEIQQRASMQRRRARNLSLLLAEPPARHIDGSAMDYFLIELSADDPPVIRRRNNQNILLGRPC